MLAGFLQNDHLLFVYNRKCNYVLYLENAFFEKSLCTHFFTTWSRAHVAGWPSVQPGNAVWVSLLPHSFFVPWFCLSAFQLLLIQISSSVAGRESDPIAVETGIWNF